MKLCLELEQGSRWSGLRRRFGAPLNADVATAALTDTETSTSALRLLLHRCPAGDAPTEVGFFLEDSLSILVEISPGPATTRTSVSAAFEIAADLGLVPIRLSTGEPSLLLRLRELEDPELDDPELAAQLAIGLGEALDRGATGSRELELLLHHARPDRSSPFEILNALDTDVRYEILEQARIRLGLRHLPAALRRDLRSGTGLAERRVDLEVTGELARIRLLRPQMLNALDPEMLVQLEEAWQEAESRNDVRAISLEGTGPAFMAGVDLDLILSWIEADRLDAIIGFVRAGHRFLERVDRSERHTLVRLHGLAVGAGAEFCAAFDTVLATPGSSLGFPETSIGIFPAMGGTQRLPRRVGFPVARWWVLGGALVPAARARELGMVDAVVDESMIDEEIHLRAHATAHRARAAHIERAKDLVPDPVFARFATTGLAGLMEGGDPAFARRLRRRPELALGVADTLLGMSRHASLSEGLAAEIGQLPNVYRTPEALDGIRGAVRGLGRSPAH